MYGRHQALIEQAYDAIQLTEHRRCIGVETEDVSWQKAFGVRPILLLGGRSLGLLDAAEDVGYFAVEEGEVEVDDGAAGVEDDVDWGGELGEVPADGLAHAALDAVAVDGLAHDLAYGESDARGGLGEVAVGGAGGDEVAHLLGELLAAGLVNALVVGVFPQAEDERGHVLSLSLTKIPL